MQTITIADIEITLELNENLQSIDIACNQIGYIKGEVDTIFGNVKTINIAGIEITLKLNKNLKSIDIACCQLGDIHGDANTIFGDVNTVDGTVNLNVTGDVLGEVLSNIIYKSEIHLKGK